MPLFFISKSHGNLGWPELSTQPIYRWFLRKIHSFFSQQKWWQSRLTRIVKPLYRWFLRKIPSFFYQQESRQSRLTRFVNPTNIYMIFKKKSLIFLSARAMAIQADPNCQPSRYIGYFKEKIPHSFISKSDANPGWPELVTQFLIFLSARVIAIQVDLNHQPNQYIGEI